MAASDSCAVDTAGAKVTYTSYDVPSCSDENNLDRTNVVNEYVQIPYDALLIFRSSQQCLIRILNDLLSCKADSNEEAKDEVLKTGKDQIDYTSEYARSILHHCDLVVEAVHFVDLLPYVHIFRQCITDDSLPSSYSTMLQSHYRNQLEKLLTATVKYENEALQVRKDAEPKCEKYHPVSSLEASLSTEQYYHHPSILLCTAEIETMERKNYLLSLLRMLKNVAPSWGNRESSYWYHSCQILRISSLKSTALQNYRTIFAELHDSVYSWRMKDVVTVMLDLDCLRKTVETSFKPLSDEQMWQLLSQDLLKTTEETMIEEAEKEEGSQQQDAQPSAHVEAVAIGSQEDAYAAKDNSKSSATVIRAVVKKSSKMKEAEKLSATEYYYKKAILLPRVTGVFFGKSCLSWVAQIPVRKGHTKQLYFSVKKYGFMDARSKAIEARGVYTASINGNRCIDGLSSPQVNSIQVQSDEAALQNGSAAASGNEGVKNATRSHFNTNPATPASPTKFSVSDANFNKATTTANADSWIFAATDSSQSCRTLERRDENMNLRKNAESAAGSNDRDGATTGKQPFEIEEITQNYASSRNCLDAPMDSCRHELKLNEDISVSTAVFSERTHTRASSNFRNGNTTTQYNRIPELVRSGYDDQATYNAEYTVLERSTASGSPCESMENLDLRNLPVNLKFPGSDETTPGAHECGSNSNGNSPLSSPFARNQNLPNTATVPMTLEHCPEKGTTAAPESSTESSTVQTYDAPYDNNHFMMKMPSFASQARASPHIPGVSYDAKRACWMVRKVCGSTITHRQFHVRKFGGFEEARNVAIQYLNRIRESEGLHHISSSETGIMPIENDPSFYLYEISNKREKQDRKGFTEKRDGREQIVLEVYESKADAACKEMSTKLSDASSGLDVKKETDGREAMKAFVEGSESTEYGSLISAVDSISADSRYTTKPPVVKLNMNERPQRTQKRNVRYAYSDADISSCEEVSYCHGPSIKYARVASGLNAGDAAMSKDGAENDTRVEHSENPQANDVKREGKRRNYAAGEGSISNDGKANQIDAYNRPTSNVEFNEGENAKGWLHPTIRTPVLRNSGTYSGQRQSRYWRRNEETTPGDSASKASSKVSTPSKMRKKKRNKKGEGTHVVETTVRKLVDEVKSPAHTTVPSGICKQLRKRRQTFRIRSAFTYRKLNGDGTLHRWLLSNANNYPHMVMHKVKKRHPGTYLLLAKTGKKCDALSQFQSLYFKKLFRRLNGKRTHANCKNALVSRDASGPANYSIEHSSSHSSPSQTRAGRSNRAKGLNCLYSASDDCSANVVDTTAASKEMELFTWSEEEH